jgi:hypothetical protein
MIDVLVLIDRQKAMEHPKWGPRNNPDAEKNITHLSGEYASVTSVDGILKSMEQASCAASCITSISRSRIWAARHPSIRRC